ncbi:MAG TPA: sensor histidine kinase [Gaiellaceae bacterium]|nr:sensor histidine kinase [Gaiellaceae bacterium]
MTRSVRSFAYLCSALVTGTLAFGLLLAGWIAASVLVVTPLVVPVLIGLRAGVGALARVEEELARRLLGVEGPPTPRSSGGSGYWGRGKAVVTDSAFWRQQLFLLLRGFAGWPLAVGVVSWVGASLWVLALPLTYRVVDEDVGTWHVESLEKALLLMPVGAVGLAVAWFGVRPLARLWRLPAGALLRPAGEARYWAVGKTVRVHALATLLVAALLVVVWATTSLGYFWPVWPIAALALLLALHAWPAYARSRGDVFVHAGVSASLGLFLVVVWALAGAGSFWPIWPLLAFALILGAHALYEYQRGEERIDVLETTRAGAVDVQENELRRIERDLHDGAQARLVALGMNLGMAEQKLAADPEAARDLVAEARAGVEEALRELRDLARGIHPPVLTDRGLEAAIDALACRSAVPVFLAADGEAERPSAAVETAAYFVAAEALTNAAKHAGATRIDVRILREPGTLRLQVSDDGRGGADASGTGLTGLRQRVEALDGKLTVLSPSGGGTTLLAELPCAS